MNAWIKTRTFPASFALIRDGEEIAQIAFGRFGAGRARVTGDGIDWTIERRGLMRQVVSVRTAAGDTLATARVRLAGSYDVTMRDGFAARFKTTKLWCAQYGWVRSDGSPLILYRLQKWFGQHRSIETLEPIADESRELLLLILGGVLLTMSEDDAMVAVAIVASAVAAGA
jgi:hypothetical protein